MILNFFAGLRSRGQLGTMLIYVSERREGEAGSNRDCYFTSDPGGFLAGSTKSETEAKKIWGDPRGLFTAFFCSLWPQEQKNAGV